MIVTARAVLRLACTLSVLLAACVQAQELPRLGVAPQFEFTNSNGRPFRSETLRGSVWILSFFFTKCRGICPAIQGRVARLQKTFEEHSNFRIVSLSVDPEHDTPERLVEYAASFQADPARWVFLTGPSDRVREVTQAGLKLNPGEAPDQHTTRIVLIDSDQQIRGYFQGTDPEAMDRLRDSVRKLLE